MDQGSSPHSGKRETAPETHAPLRHATPDRRVVVLTGNPNCGKTTLFNALTGLRAKVGNYAGVTVERKEGSLKGLSPHLQAHVLDLPGSYSLSPQSLDEQIARDVLLHRLAEVGAPDLVIIVVDASNLERNLYFATQVIELGHPCILALNMIDVASQNGHHIDAQALAGRLGVPVVPLVASTGQGLPDLRREILAHFENRPVTPPAPNFCPLPAPLEAELEILCRCVKAQFPNNLRHARAEALLLLTDPKILHDSGTRYPDLIHRLVTESRSRLEASGLDWRGAAIESRYAQANEIHLATTTSLLTHAESLSDRLDRIVTHTYWGPLIFVGIMAFMFQSIFTFAQWPMDALDSGVAQAGSLVESLLPPGDLRSLLVDGVVAGVGAVVVFLPQILLLFLFIGLLEDTGYMARAAFLMDRVMSKVGLHGKSFIPMLSSFACAIPGIMATRTIETPKDRLVTILVAPLMSCSARLPVYTLLIAACIPDREMLGFIQLQGFTLLSMYLLGITVALLMAWLFKRTLLKGEAPLLIMELPPYKRPVLKVTLRHMWDRSKIFLSRAGTVILGLSIVLWFLATYPRNPAAEQEFAQRRAQLEQAGSLTPPGTGQDLERTAELRQLDQAAAGSQLRYSFAGRLGQLIEPLIRPLGYDWKIGIGIIASFAAREVFVSTMSTVYNVSEADGDSSRTLAQTLREQRHPDGRPVYSPLTGLSLMVFYVFALQCVSTVAVVRRETNSWKWPLFQWLYMGALAWVLAFITYQGGRLLGWS
jgi:ferrous iron transport protein B